MALEAEELEIPDFLSNSSEDDIHEKMLGNLPDDLDKSEGGFLWDLTRPVAIELSEIKEYTLVEVLKSMFPITCEESYLLDYHANANGRGIVRREAVNSTGSVTVTASEGVTIPLGYGFSTESDDNGNTIEFITTEEVTIDSNGTATIPIEAVEGGTGSNVAANKIVLHTGDESGELIDEITSVTNNAPTSGGLDEEDDDTLRERITEYDQSQNNSFIGNPTDYKRWALSVAGVGSATIIPAKDDSGTVKIILYDQSGNIASKEIQDAVYDYLIRPNDPENRIAPTNAILDICSPDTTQINITAKVYLNDVTLLQIQEALQAAVISYLLNVTANDTAVRISAINNLIGSLTGVYDYEDVKINDSSSNLEFTKEQIPIFGSVILTEG